MTIRVSLSFVVLVLTLLPLEGQEKKTEQASPNFMDHVLPIFREHCLQCHNANDAEAGLAIDSFGALMEGGGSGDVVTAGDPSSSKLYLVMTHDEEPAMPPNQEPISKEKLDIIKKWIEGGLLENSGSKARKRKGPSLSFTAMDGGKPSEIVMPETLWRVPVVVSSRAAASSALAASPWAPLVAVAGQKQVSLYHTETGELEGIIPFPEGIPQVLGFSVDGGYLLVAGGTHSSKGVASVYDIKTGERVIQVGDELDTVFGADVNDDLSKIALGGPQRIVRVFDTASGESLFELKKHTDWVYTVDFSPDGVLVATGDRSGGLHVWEADTGRLYLDLVGHKGAIRGLSWRADSNVLVSASEDGTVKLWEMNNGKQLKSFNAHGGGATGVVMARDGRMVTCGKDKTVKLWNADGGAIATMPAFAEPALEAVITHDGSRVVGGDWSGRTVMWEVADTKKAVELAPNPPRLEELKSEVAGKIASLKSAVDAAVAAETAQQKQAETDKAAHAAMTAKVAETKAALAKIASEKATSDKMSTQLQTQKAALDKTLADAKASMIALKKQLDQAQVSIAAEQKLLAEAITRRDKATADKALIDGKIPGLEEQHQKLKSVALESIAKLTDRDVELAAMKQASINAEMNAEKARKASEVMLTQLNAQLAEAGKVVQTLKQQVDAANLQLKKDGESEAAAAAGVSSAVKAVEAAGSLLAKAKQQLEAASDEAAKKAAADGVAKAEQEVNKANAQKVESDKQLAEKKAVTINTTKTVEQLKQKMAESLTRQSSLMSKIPALKQQMEGHLLARDTARKQTAGIDTQLAQVASEMAVAVQAKDEAVKKMAVYVKDISSLKAEQQRLAGVVGSGTEAKSKAEKKISELVLVRDAVKPKLEASTQQVEKMAGTLASTTGKLNAQVAISSKHAESIKQLTASVPGLEKQVAAAKTKMDASSAALAPLLAATGTARKNLAEQTSMLEGIDSELVLFRKQSEKLAAEFEAASNTANVKRKALEPVQEKVTNASNVVAARETRIKQMADAMAKLQAELEGLKQAQATDEGKLKESQAELQKLEADAEAAEAAAEESKEKAEFFQSVYGA